MRAPYCLIILLATGCQPLTGIIGAKENFACQAPDGVACSSVSGVHANLHAHNLPFQRQAGARLAATPAPTGTALAMPAAGEPLRSEGRTLRIWLAPWIDSEQTLHDQAFLYTRVDDGRWRIGELRQRVAVPPRQRTSAAAGPAQPATTPVARPVPPILDKPLAHVRADSGAQAAARATVQATERQGERP